MNKFGHTVKFDHCRDDWEQYLFRFPNDYGASVVRHGFSYGHQTGRWELAVIRFHGRGDDITQDWDIVYDTPITADVLGHLSEAEVDAVLDRIEAL